MPQSEGGYVSLNNNGPSTVYNSTTEPTTPHSVFESVKRVIIGHGLNNSNQQDSALLVGESKGNQPIIVNSR